MSCLHSVFSSTRPAPSLTPFPLVFQTSFRLEASSLASSLSFLGSGPASFVSSHPFSFQRLCFVSARKLRIIFREPARKMWKNYRDHSMRSLAVCCCHSIDLQPFSSGLLFRKSISVLPACSMKCLESHPIPYSPRYSHISSPACSLEAPGCELRRITKRH